MVCGDQDPCCARHDRLYLPTMLVRRTLTVAFLTWTLLGAWEQAESSETDDTAFLLEKREVALPSGRRMNVVCAGKGSPTVLVESGLGSHMLHWQKVAGRISRLTKACFYDRAGFGYSDPSPSPLAAISVTDDLHALLHQAKIAGPLVLVGHSLGGLYTTVFANRFHKSVSGMVLIDPSFARQDKDLAPAQRAQDEVSYKASLAGLRSCAVLARSGKLSTELHEECFAFASNRKPAEKAFLLYQFTRPYRYEAMASEIVAQHSSDGISDVNSREELATRRDYGNMPLIVLTAERPQNPNQTGAESELAATAWTSWKAGHDELASRSRNGASVVVANTGHFIQLDRPDAVIEAVTKVVEAARRGHAKTP